MSKTFTIRELTVVGIFAAVTAVLAQIAIPLPFTPMPISFGLVAVYTTGILLKPRDAVFTQICYLMLGAIGIPVFGNFRGGIEALFGPTGGYLLTYPIMAGIVATALHSASSRQTVFVYAAISICVAHVVLYLGGTAWLSITTGISLQSAATLAVYPFIPLDILKIVFCITVVVPMRSRLCKS